jgi:hypothetical protein
MYLYKPNPYERTYTNTCMHAWMRSHARRGGQVCVACRRIDELRHGHSMTHPGRVISTSIPQPHAMYGSALTSFCSAEMLICMRRIASRTGELRHRHTITTQANSAHAHLNSKPYHKKIHDISRHFRCIFVQFEEGGMVVGHDCLCNIHSKTKIGTLPVM